MTNLAAMPICGLPLFLGTPSSPGLAAARPAAETSSPAAARAGAASEAPEAVAPPAAPAPPLPLPRRETWGAQAAPRRGGSPGSLAPEATAQLPMPREPRSCSGIRSWRLLSASPAPAPAPLPPARLAPKRSVSTALGEISSQSPRSTDSRSASTAVALSSNRRSFPTLDSSRVISTSALSPCFSTPARGFTRKVSGAVVRSFQATLPSETLVSPMLRRMRSSSASFAAKVSLPAEGAGVRRSSEGIAAIGGPEARRRRGQAT
mmetsp:Transcript_63525/g.206394  ORF Transcript_63525/g.206394 Transcript_63525/m.206394 type:complete len:263 (-) Transcript_63525:2-790(-)